MAKITVPWDVNVGKSNTGKVIREKASLMGGRPGQKSDGPDSDLPSNQERTQGQWKEKVPQVLDFAKLHPTGEK